jgi:uncharacterized protein YcbX
MRVGRVSEIWRYPVKSMAGERLARAAAGARGIPGDRAWALRDEAAGEIRGARSFPVLVRCAARFLAEPGEGESAPVEIVLPDGERLDGDVAKASERLSALVGRPVTLWPLRPAEDLAHYRRAPLEGPDPVRSLRGLLARLDDEPLTRFEGFPPELFQFVSPPGTYFDAFPLHLVSTASLAALRRLSPGSDADVRRFRPNFLIETEDGAEDFAEIAWCGDSLRIGSAVIDVHVPAFRCGIPTWPQAELPKDPALLRTIVREAEQNLGVYASVRTPGVVEVGDAVERILGPPRKGAAEAAVRPARGAASGGSMMGDRRFLVPPGTEILRDQYHFSQGVQVGETIWVSGQGGFDAQFQISDDVGEQARQAFRNMERVLGEAGAGLDDVVELTSYHLDMEPMPAVVAALREAFPRHQPAWTAVGVTRLALPQMKIEIKAVAVRRG